MALLWICFGCVLRVVALELNLVLQVGSQQNREAESLSLPAGNAALDAAQDGLGFLGCKSALVDNFEFFCQLPPPVLCKAALNHFSAQPLGVPGAAVTQMLDFALLDLMRFVLAQLSSLSRTF